MTGQQGDEMVPVPRATLDRMLELLGTSHEHDERVRAVGVREGQAVKTRDGYLTGYDLGHDTGLGARQDTRGYVHGILDGWAAGCQERQELADRLARSTPPGRSCTPTRAEAEAELEAGG